MAATLIANPFHRPGWVYEEKVDGWRVLAYTDAAGVRLASRNWKDLTRRFPELAAAVAELKPPTLALDGELAVFDSDLLSRFEWIRGRPKDGAATPPTLIAFDCLYLRRDDHSAVLRIALLIALEPNHVRLRGTSAPSP